MYEKPVVSVLLITYNQAPFVAQALQSVLCQETPFPIEILVGDDHSTDGTDGILSRFADDERLCIVPRPQNLGASKNLYDLQMRAKGKYLAYLEGDDYWDDPQKLCKQVEFLESHGEFIGCTHRCKIVDERGDLYARQRLNWVCQKQVYTLKDFKGLMLPGHTNAMVHRNIFQNSQGRYEELITLHPLIADRPLALLLASFGPIFRFSEAMSCYRIVRSGPEKSATATAYLENDRCLQDDYDYTKALERCARETLGVDGGVARHKKDLFVSAAYRALRRPTPENRRLVRELLHQGNPAPYLLYFPFGFSKKALDKLLGRYV